MEARVFPGRLSGGFWDLSKHCLPVVLIPEILEVFPFGNSVLLSNDGEGQHVGCLSALKPGGGVGGLPVVAALEIRLVEGQAAGILHEVPVSTILAFDFPVTVDEPVAPPIDFLGHLLVVPLQLLVNLLWVVVDAVLVVGLIPGNSRHGRKLVVDGPLKGHHPALELKSVKLRKVDIPVLVGDAGEDASSSGILRLLERVAAEHRAEFAAVLGRLGGVSAEPEVVGNILLIRHIHHRAYAQVRTHLVCKFHLPDESVGLA